MVNIFDKMLSPDALKNSSEYHREEEEFLRAFLTNNPGSRKSNFIMVGAGPLLHFDLVSRTCKNYIAIDPLVSTYINAELLSILLKTKHLSVLQKKFEDLAAKELPPGNSIWAFPFNVLPYVDDPQVMLARHLKPGDFVFISTWSTSEEAEKLRQKYLKSIEASSSSPLESKLFSKGPCDFTKLAIFKNSELKQGSICNALILQV